jgi:hypothetical protein
LFSGDEKVDARFVLEGEQLAFQVGDYDKSRDLVIDPALMWATYYGGSGYDYAYSTTTDFFGNVYMAGYTQSSSNMATSGTHDQTLGIHGRFPGQVLSGRCAAVGYLFRRAKC